MRYLNVKKTTIAVLFRRFRPLSGSKVSERGNPWIIYVKQLRFRPLTGIKVSERKARKTKMNNLPTVSVPSRGLRYLNRPFYNQTIRRDDSFRPLTGIKVSELIIVVSDIMKPWIVSVPSRGLRYLNLEALNRQLFAPQVSVPSRGLRYLNIELVDILDGLDWFPSPHGD